MAKIFLFIYFLISAKILTGDIYEKNINSRTRWLRME